jgi:hydrogenase expression/formation protein HypC
MCLAVPMQVVTRDGDMAQCAAQGIARPVSLLLVQHEDVAVGDYVMVHVGYAIQKISETDARSAWDTYAAMFAAEAKAGADA